MANLTAITPAQSLSVLALKVKENTFDLGALLKHVSIRDQIIRARMLAHDLVDSQQLNPTHSVLIVGAGAAGLTLALELSILDVECWVIEKTDEPMSLWRSVTERFVGPYMYEWPSSFYADQRFPPDKSTALNEWVATGSASSSGFNFMLYPEDVDSLQKRWLATAKSWALTAGRPLNILVHANEVRNPNLKSYLKVWTRSVSRTKGKPTAMIAIHGDRWPPSVGPCAISHQFSPQIVFLAGGMGEESTELKDDLGNVISPQGDPFWSNDQLRARNAGLTTASGRIAIFGGGDGALQDTLRVLTKLEHPIALLDKIAPANSSAEQALKECYAQLESIERQHEYTAVWRQDSLVAGKSAFQSMHDACMRFVSVLATDYNVKQGVISVLRQDVATVDLFVREANFGKAFLINRFLVLLIQACARGTYASNVAFNIHWAASAKSVIQTAFTPDEFRIDFNNGKASQQVDKVVIRLGVDASKTPGQMLGLTALDTVNRRELAQIRLPFWAG